jgi:hypothetical protein
VLIGACRDKFYSEPDRMGVCDERKPRDVPQHLPVSPRTAAFLGNDKREIARKAFLELTIPHNPNPSQRLPAKQMYGTILKRAKNIGISKRIAIIGYKKGIDSATRFDG